MAVEQLQEFTNNATTTVPSTISNVATSITVATGTGSLFPTLTGSEFFIATLVNTIALDPGFGQMEIIKVTARSGDVMTVVRGQEGTSGTNFPAGVLFELRPTAQAFNNIYTEILELETTKAPIDSPVFTGNPTAPTPTLGDDDTSIATSAFVRDAFESYGDRHVNMIINPHGSIQQETTTPVTVGGGTYFADQWLAAKQSSTGVLQAGVTTGTVSSYDPSYMFLKTTTAQASLAAGDFSVIVQPLEGTSVRRLRYGSSAARGSWLRFRASASQSGTASVAIRNASNNRSWVQTFSVTTTPTDYSFFVVGDTTGTWPTDGSQSANVVFTHSCGTNSQTATLGAWQAGNFFASTSQSNMMDTVNRELAVTDVQWNDAPILLPFQSIDFIAELDRCKRYFITIPALGTGSPFGVGHATSTTQGFYTVPFTQQVRTSISVTLSAATDFALTNSTGGSITATSFSALGGNVIGTNVAFNIGSASLTAGNGSLLIAANANARMFISSRM